MSLQTKLVLSTLTVGTVGGVGYLGSTYFTNKDETIIKETKKKTIDELVKEKFKYLLLDTNAGTENKDKSVWETNWGNYKTASLKLDKDIFELDGWTKTDTQDLTEKLKEKCKVLSKKEDTTLYENVTKYCGRPVTVKDQAEKDNLEILDTKSSGKHATVWAKRNQIKSELTADFNTLQITNTETAEKIREGCGTAQSQNKEKTNYEEIYKAYKKICTLQPEDPKA